MLCEAQNSIYVSCYYYDDYYDYCCFYFFFRGIACAEIIRLFFVWLGGQITDHVNTRTENRPCTRQF